MRPSGAAADVVPGAPAIDLQRTEIAARTGQLAAASGLGLTHFEHRVALEEPAEWDSGRPDLGSAPWETTWVGGDLPETKFRHFALDRLLGSFHPGHDPKWTAHELVHGLVGFAWSPSATPWFHALAARLCEVLPVAVYHFHDEMDLRRCERHAQGGALLQRGCTACDEAAREGPSSEPDPAWRERGRAYLEAEIAAVHRSLRTGQPVSHRAGTLDLCEDGLAYAAAHGPRLRSRAFARWVDRFSPVGLGRLGSLTDLEERVRAVEAALLDRAPLTPWPGDTWLWAAQDLGWRLMVVQACTEGPAVRALDQIVDALALAPDAEGILEAAQAYDALGLEWELPATDDVFALGMDLPGGRGRSARQLSLGAASACPEAWAAAQDVHAGFVAWDADPRRTGVGRRFAAFLSDKGHGATLLARLEAAVTHAQAPWGSVPPQATDPVRLARHVEVLRFDRDPRSGGDEPCAFAVARDPGGDVGVFELDPALARGLAGEEVDLDPQTRAALDQALLLEPVRATPERS